MPRAMRVEYPGAIYHVMDRGDRQDLLKTLAEACRKTDWQVHAYCLMRNHFHLVVETPSANLVEGMRWFLSAYTIRLNHRQKLFGHVFSGRYKALIVEGSGNGYLKTACDYVHLNPVRAHLLRPEDRLLAYPWSSFGYYLAAPAHRPGWLRLDRLLGEHGLIEDSAKSRREFERIMNQIRLEPDDQTLLRDGWKIGAEDFHDWLADKLSRCGRKGERARERSETDAALAERLIMEALKELRWREIDLAMQPKGHRVKVEIARQLRLYTPMSYQWIADRLRMGTGGYVFNLLASLNREL